MSQPVGRRQLLAGAGAALVSGALAGCGVRALQPAPLARPAERLRLSPVHADPARITSITVCTRPFRPQGPRLEVERLGDKTIVHNYGHGGSGWSLSWGSGAIATDKALATGERDIAVIGCGALGLTAALLLQRAGARVTIYAKDLPPNVRSSLATGIWSPSSRICLEEHATSEFRELWRSMARRSWQNYQSLLGLPGEPVEYIEHYDVADAADRRGRAPPDGRPAFAELDGELAGELLPRGSDVPAGGHPFGARTVRSQPWLMFNIHAYSRLLMNDYFSAGGQIRVAEFRTTADLGALREKTLVNSTGYGARALFGDESLVPVRGQLAHLMPQPDIGYALTYRDTVVVPRRDGLIFQVFGTSDYYGYGDDTTTPDRAEAEHAVSTIASLYA